MYYFAYGSNMNLDHMRRLLGWHFRVLGVARLEGFELGADPRGFATIREQAGHHTMGVLFELDSKGLDILDDFEGYPEVFGRKMVIVTDAVGKQFETWVYMEPADQFGGTYYREDYMRRVIAAAYENRLPEEWIKYLERFSPKK